MGRVTFWLMVSLAGFGAGWLLGELAYPDPVAAPTRVPILVPAVPTPTLGPFQYRYEYACDPMVWVCD